MRTLLVVALAVTAACAARGAVGRNAPTELAPAAVVDQGVAPTVPSVTSLPPAEVQDGAAPLAARLDASPVAPAEPPLPAPSESDVASTSACNEQSAQDFLVRGNFLKVHDGNQRAIEYRTEHYGYFKGFGRPGPDPRPPSASVVDTTFMGLPVKMHRKVVPALRCVEEEIRRSCTLHPYTPHALAGIRYRNTYRGGEVTNHAYGIAIDVDPSINTCCGCVPPWNDAPACKRAAKTEYDRMAMPECWVVAFERYGFYWLGHDVLRDTMHYEFLGDPDRILKVPAHVAPAPVELKTP